MKVKSNRSLILWSIGIAVIVIVGMWIAIAILYSPAKRVIEEEVITIEVTQRTVTGQTAEEDTVTVIKESQELLEEAIKAQPDGLESVAIELEDGNFSSIPDSLKDKVRFVGSLDSPENKAIAYQSLLAVASNVAKVNPDFSPVQGSARNVLIDQEIGVASVPLAVFTGANNGFYLEWVFIEDEWLFNPYPTIQSSVLSAILVNSNDLLPSENQ